MFVCNICNARHVDICERSRHLQQHAEEEIRHCKIVCQIRKCPMQFSSVDTYKKHAIRTHCINPSLLVLNCGSYSTTSEVALVHGNVSNAFALFDNDQDTEFIQQADTVNLHPKTIEESVGVDEIAEPSDSSPNVFIKTYKTKWKYEAAEFLLSLKEIHKVTEVC